uniref:ryncolin-1-like isoform X2 n=1 Tax=Ciona intestinalis TaxID=7719 RepID=UPI000EF549EB|nr:ryncolin-1-like isoform X2 [Ciona intestinalis]|eukprot:XP_026690366.1 ryncolin-1-like isoform X2 [Ciona intestinalis]
MIEQILIDYKTGFGNKLASFWIGLENIREMTKNGDNELRIDITTCNNTKIVAEYSNFTVGPEIDRYRLQLSGYQHKQECCYNANATAGHRCTYTADSMEYVNEKRFSTKDISSGTCPSTRKGGWWYDYCSHSSLNGIYDPCKIGVQYAYWRNWSPSGRWEGLRFTEMKIRPAL